MSFWDSTQGSSDGGGRPGWWDSAIDHAGPSAPLYTVVRAILFVLLVAVASGLLWLAYA